MCVIVANFKGNTIDRETFHRCWFTNPDGFGLAYAFNGKIAVEKYLSEKKSWDAYQIARSNHPDANILLHFRIGTGSKKNIENCHPFVISENAVFAHNGILDIPSTKERSDTNQYCDLLKTLPRSFYLNPYIMEMMEAHIGKWNKFLFLDKNGDFHFCNQHCGSMYEGNWFSNLHHLPWPTKASKKKGRKDKSFMNIDGCSYNGCGDHFTGVSPTLYTKCDFCLEYGYCNDDGNGNYQCHSCADNGKKIVMDTLDNWEPGNGIVHNKGEICEMCAKSAEQLNIKKVPYYKEHGLYICGSCAHQLKIQDIMPEG